MKAIFVAVAALLLFSGCRHEVAPTSGTLSSEAITDGDGNRDFIKIYHFQVTNEVEMNVTSTLTPWLDKCSWYGCGRYALRFDDQLKQRDDKSGVFDRDNVSR